MATAGIQGVLEMGGPTGRAVVVRAATLARRLDCTAAGIRDGCHGGCCYERPSKSYWPPRAHPQADGACFYLGPDGCRLDPADRPVKCLLYPLLEYPDRSVLPLHFRSPHGVCRACTGRGPKLGDALAPGFDAISADAGREIRAATAEGRDALIEFPPDVAAALRAERLEEGANVLPPPRSRRA